jgi:L-threonylcarbamoyladenylate synthase
LFINRLSGDEDNTLVLSGDAVIYWHRAIQKAKMIDSNVQRQVERGVSILKQGGIVAFPTDTVYGLGACANLIPAVERVYAVKQRPGNMALPLLLSHISQISEIAHPVPPIAWLLAANFLPGALTLVLYKSGSVLDIITAGAKTVAVRVPAHPVPVALIEGVGFPIVGTSANLSGQPSLLAASEVRAQFGDRIDLIIDGGRCPGGKESTIVDVTGETPVVLREGAISVAELQRICKSIKVREGGPG